MPRKKKVVAVVVINPLEVLVGKLVRYYDGGWHHGYLEEIIEKGKRVRIRPISGYKATAPRCFKIPAVNVEIPEEKNANTPTA